MQPDLIARIEAAQPSEAREVFEEAAIAAWGMEAGEVVINDAALYERMCRFDELLDAEAYLDAAAMFVPEGWRCHSYLWPRKDEPHLMSLVTSEPHAGIANGKATTPYFALLAAAMKARQTDERD